MEINRSPEQAGFVEPEAPLPDKKLFVLREQNTEPAEHSIFVPSRDTGSANALSPVVGNLLSKNYQITILSDGPAKQKFEKSFPDAYETERPSAEGNEALDQTELTLTDASSNHGMEGCASWVMNDKPFVLIEDNYGSSVQFLKACDQLYNHLPDKICVIDEEAKAIILQQLPDLEDRIIITGQPIYDQISTEDTEKIQTEIKQKLNLAEDTELVVFMGTDEPTLEQYRIILEQLKGSDFTVGFRKHPYSQFSYEDIYALMDELGVKYVPMDQITVDEAGAAADLVLTTWSTEGVKGIYRSKPTIHFLDPEVLEIPKSLSLPLPPVKLGASVEINRKDLLKSSIEGLLDPESVSRQTLDQNMTKFYPADGKNTERVVSVVETTLMEHSLKKGANEMEKR